MCILQAAWTVESKPLPAAWPQTGTIEFHDYGLQYRKGLEWALKGISLQILREGKGQCIHLNIHSSIFLNHFIPGQGGEGLSQHAVEERQECGLDRSPIHCRSHIPLAHTFIPTGKLESPISQLHAFGLWEETGVPSRNPHRHGDMQTPHSPHSRIKLDTYLL